MRFKGIVISAVFLTLLASGISVLIPYFVGKTFNTFNTELRTVNNHSLIILVSVIAALYLSNWLITTISDTAILSGVSKIGQDFKKRNIF